MSPTNSKSPEENRSSSVAGPDDAGADVDGGTVVVAAVLDGATVVLETSEVVSPESSSPHVAVTSVRTTTANKMRRLVGRFRIPILLRQT
jgi:hypothetical protein